mgnify:FL=1
MEETLTVMITSGLSAQLPAGGLSAGEAKSAEAVAEHMLKVGMVNVEEQFAEMAIGVREQFDLAGVALAMGSAGLSAELGAKLKVDNPWVQRSLTDIGTAAMSGVVRGQFDMESLATQLITDNVGVMAQQMKTPSKLEEAYHQSQQASQGRNANDIDEQWQTEFINDAKLAANEPLPSITFDVEDPWTAAQLGQQVGETVSRFEHVDLPRNPNGFWRGVDDVLKMQKGTIAAVSSVFTGDYAVPQDSWEAAGYAIGIPLAMGAQIITAEAALGAEAIEGLYQGSQRAFGSVTGQLEKWGFFGKNGAEGPLNLLGNEARNHIDALRLNRSLIIEQAKSIFTETGELTSAAIQKSLLIKSGEELGNSLLRNELTKISGDITDWGKYSTRSVSSPSGNFQMHFYRNTVTGDVYYGMDYKAVFDHQGSWSLASSPNFEYEPPRFNS